jgi:single-stranded DNA-specific DHH superfamily exonuclease
MQGKQHFPRDSYSLTLKNADEDEAVETIDFSYDEEFYKLKATEAENKMKKAGAVKKIAIYDENGILLYYDVQTDNLTSARKMWNMFSNASSYNIVWQAKDKSTMCIMPKRLVIPDEN